jgi:hypothetical protein
MSGGLPRDPFEHDEPYADQIMRRGILLGRALIELRDQVEPGGDEAADGLISALNALSLDDARTILLAWALTAQGLPESIEDDEAE